MGKCGGQVSAKEKRFLLSPFGETIDGGPLLTRSLPFLFLRKKGPCFSSSLGSEKITIIANVGHSSGTVWLSNINSKIH